MAEDQIPWWYRLAAPAFGDSTMGDVAESERRTERMRAYDHLKGVAETYLADSGLSPATVAQTLQTYDPDHPAHQAIVAALDEAMVAAAQGHQRGISPSERDAMGGNSVMPDYLLGEGDQKVYEVLRASNLVNAALGRNPVADPRDLVAGKAFNDAEVKEPLFGAAGANPMNTAVQNYETAAADPTKHSSIMGSPYPQHQLTTAAATKGSLARSGDTIAGQTLSEFSAWADASRRASRRADGGPEGTTIAALQRWLKNFPTELGKSHDYEWAKAATNRASPLVPDSYSDGTKMGPEDREAYIDMVKDAVLTSRAPTIQEHGASQGKAYSPATAWAMDMGHEFVDPFTAATIGVAGPLGAAKHIAKGGSILGGLTLGAGKGAAVGAAAEAAEPLNYAVAGATFPYAEGFGAFKAPSQPAANKEEYLQKQAGSDRAIADTIRQSRSMLRGR